MANRISQLLSHWTENRDTHLWVLATIIQTDGSSYRKAGAMMLINDMGQYFGLLSGGCLESDIMRQARRCWDNQQNRIIEYDMREEEDLAWQLGIGCGGMVKILLQPVHKDNDYLKLDQLNSCLEQRLKAEYHQQIDEGSPLNKVLPIVAKSQAIAASKYKDGGVADTFIQLLSPAPLLAVFGAGVDAKPIVSIAAELGWLVLLIDPRVGYAKTEYFTKASQIIRQPIDELCDAKWLNQIDVALVLTHNIKLDASALKLVQNSSAKYVGLLGPTHRTDRVLDIAKLTRTDLTKALSNPVGLRLGGELPESIALSMLAEAHAVLEKADGLSISGVLNN
jgi:xanthine/CO dehydrogenase XdhC/CoxF family maturation factor